MKIGEWPYEHASKLVVCVREGDGRIGEREYM